MLLTNTTLRVYLRQYRHSIINIQDCAKLVNIFYDIFVYIDTFFIFLKQFLYPLTKKVHPEGWTFSIGS